MKFTKLDDNNLLKFCDKLISNDVDHSLSNAKYISDVLNELQFRIDNNIYSDRGIISLNATHFNISKLLASLQLGIKPNLTNI